MGQKNNSNQAEISNKQVVTQKPAKKEPVFSLEKLRKDCYELFGVTPSTFNGATCKLEGEFTINKVKEIINKWLKTEIYIKKEDK